jgi:hypothetical protein
MIPLHFNIRNERNINCGKIMSFVVVLFVAGVITAGAEEKFGVKVYNGARYDASTSKT